MTRKREPDPRGDEGPVRNGMADGSAKASTRGRQDYSRQDMTYAVTLANKGYDVEQITRALAAKPSGKREPGSVKYWRVRETKGQDAADRYARATAEKAVRFVRDNPLILDRSTALVQLHQMRGTIESLPWATYGGPGLRRALEGALMVAEDLGAASWFGLALRQWAELVGQDMRVLRGHRDKLTALGWLSRHPQDREGRTARYKLTAPAHIHSHPVRFECAKHRGSAQAVLAHDAFRELGCGSWLVVHVLSLAARPVAFEMLGIRTGFDEVTLAEMVARLDRLDLVEVDGANVAIRNVSLLPRLDAAARTLGTAGHLDEQKARHVAERTAFRGRDVNVREGFGPRTAAVSG